MKKIVLTFGIIAGFIVSGMMFLTISGTSMENEGMEILGYTTMVIAFTTIFIGIKTYRNKYRNGTISFGKAFMIGLYITLIASAMYVAFWMIISETYGSGYMDQYFETQIENIRNSDLPQAQMSEKIQQQRDFQEMYKNPVVKVGMTLMEIFPVGLLITLISAAILKRKNAPQTAVG